MRTKISTSPKSAFEEYRENTLNRVQKFLDSQDQVQFGDLYISPHSSNKFTNGEAGNISNVVGVLKEVIDGWETVRDGRDEYEVQKPEKIPKTSEERKEAVKKFLDDRQVRLAFGGCKQFSELKNAVNPRVVELQSPQPVTDSQQKLSQKKNKFIGKIERFGAGVKSFVSKCKKDSSSNKSQGNLR